MALTMETHGPWGAGEWSDERQHRVDGDLSDDNRGALEDYVDRLRTVEALAATVHEHLDGQERPFVFGLFGDHLPALFEVFDEVGFRDDDSWGDPRYQTPYFVTGNVNVGAEPRVQNVDVSFLGSLVLDAAGVNGGEFFRMSSVYREFCGGSFNSCREGDDYHRSYVQVLYDALREQLRGDRAGGLATRTPLPFYRLEDVVRSGSAHFGAGWSAEAWGAWTVEPSAELDFRLQSVPGDDLVMAVRVQRSRAIDTARLTLNGEPLETWNFAENHPHVREVIIPAERIPADGSLRFTFDVADAVSPREFGTGPDDRRLGVGVWCSAVRARRGGMSRARIPDAVTCWSVAESGLAQALSRLAVVGGLFRLARVRGSWPGCARRRVVGQECPPA